MILTVTLNAAIDKRYVVGDFLENEVNRVSECRYFAGGKGLNVSRCARIIGAQIVATGFAGGHAGKFITDEIGKQGVEPDFVMVQGESRSCINIFDTVRRTQTEFLEPGFTVGKDDCDRFIAKYNELLPKCNVVTISGSVPKGVDENMYPLLVQKARENGKKVIVDTSGKLLTEIIKHKPNMIKPNVDEIKMITGKDINSEEDIIAAGMKLIEEGIEQVVVSLGGDGAILIRADGVYKSIVPKIETVNTVGCGDCMTAGFAIAFENKMKPESALRFAAAAASAAAMTEETGMLRRVDMYDLLEKIIIRKIG